MDTNSVSDVLKRSWTDLPVEILSLIAVRLPIIDLLSFRGTCKDFRSSSSTATASIQSTRTPWILLHRPNNPNCIIFNQQESKSYNRNIPDLAGAICLSSYQGWLLLFKDESIFFFSPFSSVKIPLPEFPEKQISGHVAAFSGQPTSPDCIISIINPTKNPFEITVISKGEKTWTQHKTTTKWFDSKPIITGAIFDHKTETFFFMYNTNSLLTFSVEDKKAIPYLIVSSGQKHKNTKMLPYVYKEDMFHKNIYDVKMMKHKLGFEDDEYVDVCGLTYQDDEKNCQRMYLNEVINVSDDDTRTRMCKVVWVQPRFFEVDHDLHW